jgi:hypothetical protein
MKNYKLCTILVILGIFIPIISFGKVESSVKMSQIYPLVPLDATVHKYYCKITGNLKKYSYLWVTVFFSNSSEVPPNRKPQIAEVFVKKLGKITVIRYQTGPQEVNVPFSVYKDGKYTIILTKKDHTHQFAVIKSVFLMTF